MTISTPTSKRPTTAAPDFPVSVRVRLLQAVRGLLPGGDERGRLQISAMTAFAVRVASAALLYLSQIFLARWMGASEFGVYVQVWTMVLVLGGLSHLGLSMAMVRLIPEYTEKQDMARLRGLLRGGRFMALGVGSLIAGLGLLGLYLFGHKLESHTLMPAYLAAICIPLYALTDLQDGIGRGHGWMGTALVPPYILRPLVLLIVMAIALFAGAPMTAPTAAAAAIVATWTAAITQTLLLQRRLTRDARVGPRTYAIGRWLTTSLPLLVTYAAELTMQNADVLVLAAHRPPAEVGMYFAAAKTMALVMFVHYAVGSAVAHRFSALKSRGDTDGLAAAVRDAVRWTFYPSLAAAVLILALGRPLLWLFSPEFTAAYPVMAILVFGFLARAAIGPAEFLLNMLGEQRRSALVAVTSAILNVGLNLLLIPRFGLIGAATATACALVFAAFANYAVAYRSLGFGISIFQNHRR